MNRLGVLISGIACVLLVGLAVLALKWGIGHAMLEPWYNQSSAAGRQEKFVERELVAAGMVEIDQARRWQNRADAFELLGHYQLTAAFWENGSQKELRAAKNSFESAIALRPSFAYSWAYLAMVKYRLGEVDDRFQQALGNAIRLAPWDPKVQMIAADFGLAVLDEVPKPLRSQILSQVERGVRQQGDLMMQIARKRGKMETFCALDLPPKVRIGCPENIEGKKSAG